MLDWVGIIAGFFKAISFAVDFLEKQQLLKAAEAEIFSRYAKGALDEIATANQVRDAVRADIAANPDRVREPDRHSRD